MIAFVHYWYKNYRYQRQQLDAPRIVAAWDALLDSGTVWWLRRSNGL